MASWFTRALDRVTPWDRGGEVQRRQEKKKKQDDEQNRSAPARNTRSNQQQDFNQQYDLGVNQGPNQGLQPKKPTNIFETLNKNLNFGQPNSTVSVFKTPDTQPVEQPKPGTIIKPKQNLFDKVRDQFDANTEADKFRRQEENKVSVEQKPINYRNPVVDFAKRNVSPTGLFNIGKELAQGTARFPIETAQTIEQSYRVSKEGTRLQKNGYPGFSNPQRDELARKNEPSKIWNPTGWQARLFGKGPVESLQTQSEKLSDTIDQATGKKPSAVGLTAALLALSVLPGGLLAKSFKTGAKGAKVGAKNIDELADVVNAAPTPRPAPVTQNIPINEIPTNPINVPVRNMTQPGQIIQEFPGDARIAAPPNLIKNQADDIRAQDLSNRFWDNKKTAIPDQRIQGVTPRTNEPFKLDATAIKASQDEAIDAHANFLRQVGEGNGVDINPVAGTRVSNNVRFGDTKGKRMTKADWREEAERQLKAGEADPSIQKIYNDSVNPEVQSLLAKGEQAALPVGRPITVKQVNGIDVMDNTKVPQDLPDVPGTVRPTTATAPSNIKSEAVANTPVVSTPPSLPREGQNILDNPKKFNKREVASARKQRNLARKLAKTKEETADAMQRIEATKVNPVVGQTEGFAPTGEFRAGKRGRVSESASRATERQAGTREMADRSVDDFLDEISTKESLTPGDRRRISAAKENLMKTDPENFRSSDQYQVLDKLEKASRSDLGRGLALIPRTIRKTANSEALTARWKRKIGNVLDDPSKMTNDQWNQVQSANDTFTTARNRAGALEEQFRKSGSEADFKAWEDAYKAARDADTAAKMTEVKVAQRVLKDEKGANVTKVIDELKKEADVNTMDYVTANMLSGTGTGFRNTFGTELAGIENRIGANLRAKAVKGIFGENVGGFDRKGARFGRKFGFSKWTGDAKRRADNGGKNPIEWGKNWSTTINSGGESSMQSQVYSRLAKYYKNQFSDQGLSGKDLDLRMRHAMITDPDNMADIYLDSTMRSSGLTGLFEKGQTIERSISDLIGGNLNSKAANTASKLIMRLAVGFPTATGNFVYQSGKRLTLGLPSYIESGVKAGRGDKQAAALAFERGLKESGSGTAMLGLGAALGSSGMISGPYPSDKEERALWEREGISENSIKIGGAWYPIPQGAGMFGLPLLTGAAIGRDGAEGVKEMYNPVNLAKLLPTYQIQGILNLLGGDGKPQDLKNLMASTVRGVTPVGALLAQIAKSFDPTKNDTTTKNLFNNVLDQVYSGVPGVNNAMNIPDKTDKEGNVINNPNPLQIAFGAQSAVQGGGEQRTKEINAKTNSALDQIDQYGLLNDPNMNGVLKETGLDAYNKSKSGKQLDESDIKALKEGLVKGVSSEGSDTAYLEKGQYETNLAVLKLKRDMMKEDPTTKPSSIKDIDTAIKRGEVYKNNKIPYDMISEYKSVGVDEWRKMGIAPDEKGYDADVYDPDMYQKLWDLDQLMTKSGVSYKKGSPEKNKYAAKEPAKGRGSGSGKGSGRGSGSGVRKIDTSFGTLKDGSFAPKVQAYESIGTQSGGGVPRIGVKRPNIVHKISSSG